MYHRYVPGPNVQFWDLRTIYSLYWDYRWPIVQCEGPR